jgi:hypothetical protein
VDDTQRNLVGSGGLALVAAALTWVLFGFGALVSAERIAPASGAFLFGVFLVWLAWRPRSKAQEPDGGASSVPSSVTINQAPGSGGPAWGTNPRGGDGGDTTIAHVHLEAGQTYPVNVGQGGKEGQDGGNTSFAGITARGGKSAPPEPGVVGLPGAPGIVQIIGPLSLDDEGNPILPPDLPEEIKPPA